METPISRKVQLQNADHMQEYFSISSAFKFYLIFQFIKLWPNTEIRILLFIVHWDPVIKAWSYNWIDISPLQSSLQPLGRQVPGRAGPGAGLHRGPPLPAPAGARHLQVQVEVIMWHPDHLITRAAKITSFVAAVIFTAVFVVIWPGSMLSGVTDGQ